MKNTNKVKRINLNVPLYLLKEIDEMAMHDNETRTDIFVKGAEQELEERKRKKKLEEYYKKREKSSAPIFMKEVYTLGANEWVRKLRQEGEK